MKKKIFLMTVLTLCIAFLTKGVYAASASISANKTSVTVGTKVTVTVKVTAAAWNLSVSGSASDSIVGFNMDAVNQTTTKTYSINTSKAGTYKVSLTGDITDQSSETATNVSKSVTITVKEKPVTKPSTNSTTTPTQPDKEFTTSKGFKGYTKNGMTYIDGILIANKTYPLPSTYKPGGLTSTTQEAFDKMKAGAKKDGINLVIKSGYRSYATQKSTYNYYVSRDGVAKADTYSARPGHSEHQTGLAMDLNIINDTFHNTKEAKWLASNCYKYGFILRYPKGKTNETGYKYESWHFRYVGVDLATKLYNDGDWITLESYFGITSKYN
jgi:D-alanyl-D-alanine carboxypeptidase